MLNVELKGNLLIFDHLFFDFFIFSSSIFFQRLLFSNRFLQWFCIFRRLLLRDFSFLLVYYFLLLDWFLCYLFIGNLCILQCLFFLSNLCHVRWNGLIYISRKFTLKFESCKLLEVLNGTFHCMDFFLVTLEVTIA